MHLRLRQRLVVLGAIAVAAALLLRPTASSDLPRVTGDDAPSALHGCQGNASEAQTSAQSTAPSSEQIQSQRSSTAHLGGAETPRGGERYPTEPAAPDEPLRSSPDSRVTIELQGGGYKTGALVNGVAHGLWQVVDESGNVFSEIPYEGGKIQGKMISYASNGDLRGETEYVQGGVSGWVKGWHATGHLAFEIESRRGAYNGVWREWYSDGKPERDAKALDGKLDGACVFYLPSGEIDAACSGPASMHAESVLAISSADPLAAGDSIRGR